MRPRKHVARGWGGASPECACALPTLARGAAVSRAPRRCFGSPWQTSPANPVPAPLDCAQGGDLRRVQEGATMPVRGVAQPLGFLIPAAWHGGAAVAMEARIRQAAGVGRGRVRLGWADCLGSLVGGLGAGGVPAGPGRGPGQALPLRSVLQPAGPALLDIKAQRQRMRSRSQPCSGVGRLGAAAGGGLWMLRTWWALYTAQTTLGR